MRRAGQLVELTPTEFGLLRYLLSNAGRVLSKAQILDHVWNYDFGGDSNVVETYISYLRKKIDTTGEPLIHTVRGFGYSLRLQAAGTVSLRVRLMLVTLAMVAVALFLAGWATHAALRSFLIDRVDRELTTAQLPQVGRFGPDDGYAPSTGGGRPAAATTRPRDSARTPSAQIRTRVGRGRGHHPREPRDRRDAPRHDRHGLLDGRPRAAAPGSTASCPCARARPRSTACPPGLVPLGGSAGRRRPARGRQRHAPAPPDDRAGRGGRSRWRPSPCSPLWLVRLGLRPLERIGTTADAIAGGDLSQRVADDDPRTEVGRLGRTLNTMLDSIEKAFAERRESERRLRQFVGDASHELQTPAHLGARLRGALPPRRRAAAGRPRDHDAAHRGRGRPHGRAGGRPAAAGAAGRGPPARAAAPEHDDPGRGARGRRPRGGAGPPDRAGDRGPGRGGGRRRPPAPGGEQPAEQRPLPHAAGRPGDRPRAAPRDGRGRDRGGRLGPRAGAGARAAGLRALLPRRRRRARAPAAAAGWACRSSPPSPRPTAGAPRSSRPPGGGPPSASSCRLTSNSQAGTTPA